jgi:4-hydroxy-tetrahydrodipicolinate synthase
MIAGGVALGLSGTVGAQRFIDAGAAGFATPASQAGARDKKFVPVMITPFTSDNKIDFDALNSMVEYYLAAGAKGLFAVCGSSEMYNLSNDERLALAAQVVRKVNGRVPVVATGSFGETIEDKAEFVKKMYATGVHAVILISSHFALASESDEVLFANYEKLCGLTGNIPLGFYECPDPYKRVLTPGLFKALLETKRLLYHKDTSIDLEKIKAKLALIKNNPLEFYDAHTPNAMYSLQLGAKGMACIAGNFYPEILVWMCNNATNPDKQQEVQWLQSELTRTDRLVSHHYPMSAKYFMHKRGVPIQVFSRRSPLPLTAEEQQNLDSIYNTVTGWGQRLGIKSTWTPA